VVVLVGGSIGLIYYLSGLDFDSRGPDQQAKGPSGAGKREVQTAPPKEESADPNKTKPGQPVQPKVEKEDPNKVSPPKEVVKEDPNKVKPDQPVPPKEVVKEDPNATKPRTFVSTAEVYAVIAAHLKKTAAAYRRHQRYFTLQHLHNNKRLTSTEIDRCRSALTQLVRHLRPVLASGEAKALDPGRLVYNVDLRSLGWDRNDGWRELLKAYPYGLDYTASPDDALAQAAGDTAALTRCDVAAVRADWFVTAMSRPPLLPRLAPKAVAGLPQPVQAVAAVYGRAISLEEAALELGLPEPTQLRNKIRDSELLLKLGLQPLVVDQRIDRGTWAAAFPHAATELDGTPSVAVP
jgi:hypothetical protein